MASKSSLVLVLFLVLVCASTLTAEVYPISYFDGQTLKNLAKFAIAEYNKKSEPDLYFIEIVGGKLVELSKIEYVWYLEVRAAKCSEPHKQAIYVAQIFDNKDEWKSGIFYQISFG